MSSFISKNQKDRETRLYEDIQKDRKTEHNPETKRYYDADERSFVFEKDKVLYLLSHPEATHLRIYYGAVPTGSNPHGKAAGTPTMILSAAKGNKYEDVEGTVYIQWPTGLDDDGEPLP
jgi:hypothetical protein